MIKLYDLGLVFFIISLFSLVVMFFTSKKVIFDTAKTVLYLFAMLTFVCYAVSWIYY